MKEAVRTMTGVPLIILSHNAINLEKPSNESVKSVSSVLEDKQVSTKQTEMAVVKKLKEKMKRDDINTVKRIHQRRKAKGPNPLSCKKAKNKNKK